MTREELDNIKTTMKVRVANGRAQIDDLLIIRLCDEMAHLLSENQDLRDQTEHLLGVLQRPRRR